MREFMILWQARGLVLLAALLAVFSAPALAAKSRLADTELQGGTYRSFELVAPVPDFCRKVCEKDEGCQAWTFAWPGKKGKRAMCFLKRSVSGERKDTCCISGYKKRGMLASLGKAAREWLKREEGQDKEGQDEAPADNAGEAAGTPSAPATSQARQGTTPPAGDETAQSRDLFDESQALAQKRAFCRDYARRAIRANEQARELGCGYAGGLWGASYNGYFNWCMNNPPEAAERNTQRRAEGLRRCRVALQNTPPGAPYGGPARDEYAPEGRFGGEGVPPYWRRGPEYPPAARPYGGAGRGIMRNARWVYSWLKRGGPGPRASMWRPTLSGKCPLVRACACPQGDSCRMYEPGEIAIYWPLGCDGPPAYVVCRVRRR